MKLANELTREEIAPALAEAQGYVHRCGVWWVHGSDKKNVINVKFDNPITNAEQRCKLTEDPEIHTGMIDVLDGWLSIYDEQIPYRAAIEGAMTPVMWQHNPEYLQDIRLWQLRACVEYLRRQK